LKRRAGVALLLTAGLAACAAGQPAPQPGAVPPTAPRDGAQPIPAVMVAPQGQDPVADAAFGPEILLPRNDAADDEIARVGDLVLRKSHAYTRLQSAHPKLALSAVDLLVFDILVARHAQQYGIRVDPGRVEALGAAEERGIASQVAAELGADMDLQTYVWRMFGMRLSDWRSTLRLRTAQRLYQGYVIRYLALREDRVQVRFLVHKDQKTAQEVVDKVRGGADFATLALRWSEDATRRDGGLLPPFGRGFQHPVVDVAFGLLPGQVSAPFQGRHGDEQRWFVVYCLAQLPGRDVPFAAVQVEIDRELEQRPLTQLETNAYTLRWRGELELAPK
jgi:peptidyl-prolyl cis-trans isomerase C